MKMLACISDRNAVATASDRCVIVSRRSVTPTQYLTTSANEKGIVCIRTPEQNGGSISVTPTLYQLFCKI